MITPTVGRIVLYTLSETDVQRIIAQRPAGGLGLNLPFVGMVLPAVVVRVWGQKPDSLVNLKVFLDGPDDLWVGSAKVEDEDKGERQPGAYHWMPYQIGQAKKHAA